jgi:hypothetical protein
MKDGEDEWQTVGVAHSFIYIIGKVKKADFSVSENDLYFMIEEVHF